MPTYDYICDACAHEFEEFEFGVYQGWAPASEVTDVSEFRQ